MIAGIIGTLLGGFAGYFGGWIDGVIGEMINIFMMMPTFFLILIVVALFGSGLFNVMVVIGLTTWVGNAKLMRAQAMSLRQRTFIKSAESIGESRISILFKHIIPNGIFPIIANTTMGVAGAILTESSLAFLGLGDPNVISWGQIIQNGKSYLVDGWWMCVFAGLAIIFTVVTFYLIGDGLNRVLSPKLRNLGKEGRG
jgi:peptide/nickel transport system permease protein